MSDRSRCLGGDDPVEPVGAAKGEEAQGDTIMISTLVFGWGLRQMIVFGREYDQGAVFVV